MTKPFSLCAFRPFLLAAVLAAAGVGRAGADALTLTVTSGVNYTTAIVTPKIADASPGATLTLVATDPTKAAPTVVSGLSVETVQQAFPDLTAARLIPLDGYILAGGVTNAAAHELHLLGRLHDWEGWIRETPETYGEGTGTGEWSGREYASVSSGFIQIDTTVEGDTQGLVTCTVDAVPTPRRGYILSTQALFPVQTVEYPDPTGQRFGLSIGCPDFENLEDVCFAYVENEAWTVVDRAVANPQASTNWQVSISVDCKAETATYYVRASDADPWTVLGTAAGVGSDSVTVASFTGVGAIDGLKGDGFDAQILDVAVEFAADNLFPGCNFEETVITGRVSSAVLHETDLEEGTYRIRLTAVDGTEELVTDEFRFLADGTVEFYVRASDLTPGTAYRAEVVLPDELETYGVEPSAYAVMARALTNELWGVDGYWVCEDAQTFVGEERGTGLWTTNDESFVYAAASNDWIWVRTVSETEAYPSDARVMFHPTNAFDQMADGYVATIRAIFPDAVEEPAGADAVFGMTVAHVGGEQVFLCLSNRVWQAVPRALFAPSLNVEYEFSVYVRYGADVTENPYLHYVVRDSSGRSATLMTVQLEADLRREFERVDISGVGRVTDLAACPYSTDLLTFDVTFDADTLVPGTNFEATAANGKIHFTQLWTTDRTNGVLRVVVRDKYGTVVGNPRQITFRGIDEDKPFDYYIEGLTPGETYTVSVEASVKGIDDSGSDAVSGAMARVVTNGEWAVSNVWIREDVETFAGVKAGTGVWTFEEGAARTNETYIAVDTPDGEYSAAVNFAATNELPDHTGYELRTRLCFDDATTEMPTVTGKFGIVLKAVESASETAYQFAVIVNGVWTDVSSDVYEPAEGVEYELAIRVDRKRQLASYAIRGPKETLSTVLADFEIEETLDVAPDQVDFYGTGRVRSHEGDGFDVTLVEISSEIDPASQVPGTNFASQAVGGQIRIRQIWLSDKTGSYTIVVRDSHGGLVATETLEYAQLTNQNFCVYVPGLAAGEVYDVSVEVNFDGAAVETNTFTTVMGRKLGGWIREDAGTFRGLEPGTGVWRGTNGVATVVETEEGEAIRLELEPSSDPVSFDPTNNTPSVVNSVVRELRFGLDFEGANWLKSAEAPPEVPANTLAAATLWCDDSSASEADWTYALAVVGTNATWVVLDETRGLTPTGFCSVEVLIDFKTGFVRYRLATPTATNTVHQYEFEPSVPRELNIDFAGVGLVKSMDGDVWDANLIAGGTNEYADLDSAIAATDETLSPLWWADQLVTLGRGLFTVYDPDHMLTVRFPDWYFVEISGGDVRIYRFNASNNWIDYAESGSDHIVTNAIAGGTLFFVKTPEGLSWIAAQATNAWISGRIELAGDIDLTAHNWTPIAGFSGEFDGCGRTVVGLNNTNRFVNHPGGEYIGGPTNAWGRSAYGLFGTATNATMTGVAFRDVAISNIADSVAALAGALAGNCAVSNVTVDSGSILGVGGTVAGLVGFADFSDFLTVVANTNRASVTAESDGYEGRWAAGLLCVAGPTNETAGLGAVVVTNNANYGSVSNTLYDADLLGGNVAQILAGTTVGARFGEVHLTNNLAAGAVDAYPVRSPGNFAETDGFAAVNLAPAYWGFDADGIFRTSFDANDPGAVAVDPVRHTARMLSGQFVNGAPYAVGLLNDMITARDHGSTLTLTQGLESWGSVVLDRDIAIDLGGNLIYTTYVESPFAVGSGVHAAVTNGEIVVGRGETAAEVVEPFAGDPADLENLVTNDLIVTRVDDTFYERTVLALNGETVTAFLLNDSDYAAVLNTSDTLIELYSEAEVEIDVEANALKIKGYTIAKLSDSYGFKVVTDSSGAVIGFEVKIANSAAPTIGAPVFDGEAVRISVENAKPGFWYAIQSKATLVEEWPAVPESGWQQATSAGLALEAQKEGDGRFYRVIMTDTDPND